MIVLKVKIQTIFLIGLFVLATSAYANNPTNIPWPVGSSSSEMNKTKTLMNSYGDPQNDWSLGIFHTGIDIDSQTETPNCDDVLSVLDGAAIVSEMSSWESGGHLQWTVITTEGTGETNHEDNGWLFTHLADPHVYGWVEWKDIDLGDLISNMHPYAVPVHTHLKWTTWGGNDWCYVNPLDYLTPAPMQGTNYTWTFNPEGYTNDFEYFFLEDMGHSAWPENSGDVIAIMMDEDFLFGAVDVFFGFGLSGVGQSTTPECGRNDLAPEKIEWNIQRETVTSLEMLVKSTW